MIGVVAVKVLVVAVIPLSAGKTMNISISLVGATKIAVVDETVVMNMEAIALVVTKTLVIVVVVVVVVVAKSLLVADVLVAVALLLLLLLLLIVPLVVESMNLLVGVAMPMVVSLDPGLTSSGTGSGCWGHASLLKHLGRVVFVLVVVRAHADGDTFFDLRLSLSQNLALGLRLGLDRDVDLDRGINRDLNLRTRRWQRGVALFTAGTVMDRSQGLGHGFISRDWGTALITIGAFLSQGARGSLQETGGLGADPWFLCLCLGNCCWYRCGDKSGGDLRTLFWLGRLLGSFDVIHPLAVDVNFLAEV